MIKSFFERAVCISLLAFLIGCQEAELPTHGLQRAFTSPDQDARLRTIQESFSSRRAASESILDRADWNNVYSIHNPLTNRTSYTVRVFPEHSGSNV
jgi:hypothetical protein